MTLPNPFPVELVFLSDWHVGTGQGRLGTVDATVCRDGDGLPFVPAKTLLGLWRDACETVASAFDRGLVGGEHTWADWVTWLFGSQPANTDDPVAGRGMPPVPAALDLTPARAPGWLRGAVAGRPALAQAAVVLRPGVSIEDSTGTAADRLLRVEERALPDLCLFSTVRVATPGKRLPETAEVLLRAGAKLVDALGGRRNRGSGRVGLLLPRASIERAETHPTLVDRPLAALIRPVIPEPGRPPAPPLPIPAQPYGQPARARAASRVLRLKLRVLTPVVAADSTLGNVVTSRDSIPGTTLLGAILSMVNNRDRVTLDDLAVGDALPALVDPADPTGMVPALPVPMVWSRADKGRGRDVHNVLAGKRDADHRDKPMTGRVAATADGWRPVSSSLSVSTHAVVDDAARRPTVTGGGVYTYLGICPGTQLCCDITLPHDVQLRLPSDRRLRLGRSRKDDFGLVEVTGVSDPVPEPPPPPGQSGGLLRVWCLSDLLLRDDRLLPDPTPHGLATALTEALAPTRFRVVPEGTRTSVTRREGFVVRWGRPRMSQVALAAGSVVTLEVTGELDPDRLAEVQRHGLGERVAEGCGRLRFNPPELTTERPAVVWPAAEDAPQVPDRAQNHALPKGHRGEPHPIELNAWRQAIGRASARIAPDDLLPGLSEVARCRAQLGALRAQVEHLALAENGAALIGHWLDDVGSIEARRAMWTPDNHPDLLKDLRALLVDDHDLVWRRLGLAGSSDGLVLAPGREELLRDRLWSEAVTTAVTSALRELTHGPSTIASKLEERS